MACIKMLSIVDFAAAAMQTVPASDPASPKKRGRPLKGAGGSLRAELIEKSAQLFRERGYENTTVRDIAAATGIQAGSWFYHFKTKQDILAAIMEQGVAQSLAQIEAIAAQGLPARAMLRQLVEVHLHTLLAPDHHFIPVLLYEARALDEPSRARIVALKDRYEAVWDDVIARLHQSGDWALPTRFDRLLMFGALNWTVQWYKADGAADIAQLADAAMQFILRTPER
jgi:AcrR family transcriptional regulator